MAKKEKCPLCKGKGHLDIRRVMDAAVSSEVSGRKVVPQCLSAGQLLEIQKRNAKIMDPLDPLTSTHSAKDRYLLLCHLAWLEAENET